MNSLKQLLADKPLLSGLVIGFVAGGLVTAFVNGIYSISDKSFVGQPVRINKWTGQSWFIASEDGGPRWAPIRE